MSGIVLSAAVRQNLLSLQNTAELLSSTQNRLASGKKVNTALDNPTNFFTAQGLDNRASDINNLLDGIGNGVQVLQAANTGLTSLQQLVDTAKSIANQVLQTTTGYTPKSTATSRPALPVGSTCGQSDRDGTTIKSGETFAIAATGGGTATTLHLRRHHVHSTTLNTALAAEQPHRQPRQLQRADLHHDQRRGFVHDRLRLPLRRTAPVLRRSAAASPPPLADANSQATRASLVSQYNNIITQITTTSQDASFNGINLLNGDDLKLTFNETGKSTLTVTGVTL